MPSGWNPLGRLMRVGNAFCAPATDVSTALMAATARRCRVMRIPPSVGPLGESTYPGSALREFPALAAGVRALVAGRRAAGSSVDHEEHDADHGRRRDDCDQDPASE